MRERMRKCLSLLSLRIEIQQKEKEREVFRLCAVSVSAAPMSPLLFGESTSAVLTTNPRIHRLEPTRLSTRVEFGSTFAFFTRIRGRHKILFGDLSEDPVAHQLTDDRIGASLRFTILVLASVAFAFDLAIAIVSLGFLIEYVGREDGL